MADLEVSKISDGENTYTLKDSEARGSVIKKADKATTLAGYGITDAKITSGTITLGSDTITPLTSSSTLDATKVSGTLPTSTYNNTTYSVATTSANGLMSSTDKTNLDNTKTRLTNTIGGDAWSNASVTYAVNDCVIYSNKIYACILEHTSSDSILPTDTTYWRETSIESMLKNFQGGVDSIYNAVVAKGTTPDSKSLSDVVSGINNISSGKYIVKIIGTLTAWESFGPTSGSTTVTISFQINGDKSYSSFSISGTSASASHSQGVAHTLNVSCSASLSISSITITAL